MPRQRNPNRDKAYQIWLEHGGNITNRQIADMIGENEKVVAVWKQRDKWNVVQQSEESCTTNKKRGGAPRGNKNAVGNSGGPGGPPRNDKAVTHGFFRKYLPDDDEMREIIDQVGERSPADMIWDMIEIKYMAIIRALKIMYVRDQDDITKVLKKRKSDGELVRNGDGVDLQVTYLEEEWEYQMPWDKYATYLNAQSRAISELRSLIRQFLEMSREDDERRLKIQQMQLDIEKTKLEIQELQEDKEKQPTQVVVRRWSRDGSTSS
ncbi:phage terminase small subunit [Effusibacillus consociatus]|uniref:Phage terminase small subunit n=1 Tax=Effusibacillus consociatus TaxID=1117041 RepID=A0ABV9Q2M1_9BACL